MDMWQTIEEERRALISDLSGLSDDEWATPSLCAGWSVRDVLAHMTGTAKITPGSFFPKLLASGLNFNRLQAKDIATERGGSPADTLINFEGVVTSRKHPPGPGDTMLGETIIHSQDIRGALGLEHGYPAEAAIRVADFYKNSNLIVGTKRRICGLTLRATDTEWTHGTGPEVAGPIIDLVMAMTGRQSPQGTLTGEGAPTLQARR
jgi:uncharacterized protein (TIGR03083 family)